VPSGQNLVLTTVQINPDYTAGAGLYSVALVAGQVRNSAGSDFERKYERLTLERVNPAWDKTKPNCDSMTKEIVYREASQVCELSFRSL
jgi:hypothetical protein